MTRRKFGREFKVEALRLVADRGVPEVSQFGFHARLGRPTSTGENEKSFKASDRTYWARRVWRDVLGEIPAGRLHRTLVDAGQRLTGATQARRQANA